MRTEPDIFMVVTYKSKGVRLYLRTTKHYYVVQGLLIDIDNDKVLQKTYYRTTMYGRALQEFAKLELKAQNWKKNFHDPNGENDRDSDGGSPS